MPRGEMWTSPPPTAMTAAPATESAEEQHAGDAEAQPEHGARAEVGLGQPAAGDDGLAVRERARGRVGGAGELAAQARVGPASSCLRTLPVALRGSSARNVTCRGTL